MAREKDDRHRLLLLERSVDDAKATLKVLRVAGLSLRAHVTSSREGFERELENYDPQIIVADHDLPGFNGMEALELVRQLRPHLPFILLSDSTGQEEAVALLQKGATDYVSKDRMERLAHVVRSALQRAQDRAQKSRLDRENRNAEKLDAMGRVAAGVAHDFNNILTVISGCAELALGSLDRKHPARAQISEIRQAARRASELTSRLLVFSRHGVAEPVAVDLGATVRSMAQVLKSLVSGDIDLRIDTGSVKSTVLVDQAALEHVIINLVVNAKDAMPKGGSIWIRTYPMQVTEKDALNHADWSPGEFAVLEVADTGTGMHPEAMGRIFEPFFTTKGKDKGTGLGLAMLYGFAKQLGGHVEVSSTPNHGSTFRVFLPTTDRPARMVTSTKGMPAMAPAGTTVLVAEDERSIRLMVRESLRQVGYEVLEAADGEEALKVAGNHQGKIDILLTDWMMPKLSGPDLARQLRTRRPETRVLVMSGYAGEEVKGDSWREFAHGILEKPFKLGSLRKRLREVLESD